ncbi:MAG: class I SAM-dependent methyltransferase [Deltaproteobacteria bacterium]|nr:class I SAM-dependent methyltransferase [Deltaproteobacteria bacterium]
MTAFFDRVAARYDRAFAPTAADTAADLAPPLVGRTGVALDLGCGTGRAFPHLRAAGLRVIGLDASRPMLLEAARRASAREVARVRADLYARWPLRDRSIDVLLAFHSVLAHPPGDPERAWRHVGDEMRRVARAGALVVVDLPEPSWAATYLRAVGPDRFLHEAGGVAIEAVIPAPSRVLAALGLPLSLGEGPLGARAIGEL